MLPGRSGLSPRDRYLSMAEWPGREKGHVGGLLRSLFLFCRSCLVCFFHSESRIPGNTHRQQIHHCVRRFFLPVRWREELT